MVIGGFRVFRYSNNAFELDNLYVATGNESFYDKNSETVRYITDWNFDDIDYLPTNSNRYDSLRVMNGYENSDSKVSNGILELVCHNGSAHPFVDLITKEGTKGIKYMSGFDFTSFEAVYDGGEHFPSIGGALPVAAVETVGGNAEVRAGIAQGGDSGSEIAFQRHIVGIDKEQECAGRAIESRVSRGGQTSVAAVRENPDARVPRGERAGDRKRAVCRSVVHGNHLEIALCLA